MTNECNECELKNSSVFPICKSIEDGKCTNFRPENI